MWILDCGSADVKVVVGAGNLGLGTNISARNSHRLVRDYSINSFKNDENSETNDDVLDSTAS